MKAHELSTMGSAGARATSSHMRISHPQILSATSPLRKDVMLRVLSAALREADSATALKNEELAAARAMLHHRSRGQSPSVGGAEAPAPGVVAKLHAGLAEAAEERRNLRQQLQVRWLVGNAEHDALCAYANVSICAYVWLECLLICRRCGNASRSRRTNSANGHGNSMTLNANASSLRSKLVRCHYLLRITGSFSLSA